MRFRCVGAWGWRCAKWAAPRSGSRRCPHQAWWAPPTQGRPYVWWLAWEWAPRRARCRRAGGVGAGRAPTKRGPRLHQVKHAEKLSPVIFKKSAVLPFERRFSSRLHECLPSTLRELCGPLQRGVSFRCQSLDDTPCPCFHDAFKCFLCVGLSRSP